jgi:hypothetical protein
MSVLNGKKEQGLKCMFNEQSGKASRLWGPGKGGKLGWFGEGAKRLPRY